MARSENKTSLVAGTAGVLALAAVTVLFLWLRNPHRVALAEGKRAIARHLAEPCDLTAYYQTPASYFDKITQFPAWKAVPRGFQTFDHVRSSGGTS